MNAFERHRETCTTCFGFHVCEEGQRLLVLTAKFETNLALTRTEREPRPDDHLGAVEDDGEHPAGYGHGV